MDLKSPEYMGVIISSNIKMVEEQLCRSMVQKLLDQAY